MKIMIYFVVFFLGLLILPSGCAPAKKAFLLVQLCVNDKPGATELVGDLKDLAHSKNMEFFDSSAETARDLPKTGYVSRERSDGSPVINVGVLRKDGLFVGGGNLGLPGYQVQLGFTKGSDEAESQSFAKEVISRLEERWRVEVLPDGAAATPKPDCR
jgi:hypothetical protein